MVQVEEHKWIYTADPLSLSLTAGGRSHDDFEGQGQYRDRVLVCRAGGEWGLAKLAARQLPCTPLDGWGTAPGVGGRGRLRTWWFLGPHSHPCPVVGYVIEGSLRMQVKGGPETVCKAGESFYEAPGGTHLVSANASDKEPARFVAFFTCDRAAPLSVVAPEAQPAEKE